MSSISQASSNPQIVDLSTSEEPPKASTWWSGYVAKATASVSITVDSTDSSSSSTTKKSRRSSKEVNRIRVENAMKRRDSQVRYKQALKEASSRWNESITVRREAEEHTNYSTSLKSSLNDIKVQSCQAIVDDINKTLQNGDQKITKTTVQ